MIFANCHIVRRKKIDMKLNKLRCFYKQLFLGIIVILFLGCSKSLHISRGRFYFAIKNRDRVPSFLFRHKVEKYFDKWHAASKPIDKEDLRNLDSISRLGYDIYESLMSDSVYEHKDYEYIVVPNRLKITLLSCSSLDSCLKSPFFFENNDSVCSSVEITDFRPQVKNRKCLYLTNKYQKHFYRFSAMYGVKPYVLINSPLMHGGDRYMETSPFVDEIKVYKNSNIVSIVYSFGTSDYESFFKYDNNKLIFIRHRSEMAVD